MCSVENEQKIPLSYCYASYKQYPLGLDLARRYDNPWYLHSGFVNVNYKWQSTVFSRVQDAQIIYLLICAYFSCFNNNSF